MPIPTQGWLPVSLQFDPHTSLLGGSLVRWLEFGAEPLAEPFFSHTVARLRKHSPPAREVETTFDAVLTLAARLPAVTPAGFIFHVSRCGSTLIANALKTARGLTVVAEPDQMTPLLLPHLNTGSEYGATRWEQVRGSAARAMCSLFAHYRTGEAERLVLKFPSIGTLALRTVRRLWPETPCVVVVRDPVEVIVANLEGGLWMDLQPRPERCRAVLGWEGAGLPPEEFCARGLGQYLTAALEAVDDGCKVVDYEDLGPARMREIAAFLNIELPAGAAGLDEIFGRYSKSTVQTAPFRDDRFRKQQRATPAVRAAAREWALPSYVELRGRGAF